MTIDFTKKFMDNELSNRIRAIMGVPEEILENSTISSPTFKISASRYINKTISKYEESALEPYIDLLNIAYLYYMSYMLCAGMPSRLPKQMENVSTKTIMQSIDWDSRALDMLNKCDDIIEGIQSDIDDEFEIGNSFAVLSDESEYPNTSI